MRYVGDVHGMFEAYKKAISDAPASIALGDMGIGVHDEKEPGGVIELPDLGGNHRFIRGNHDNPQKCQQHPNWIPDGDYDPDTRTFFLGGALSMDQHIKNPKGDWWPDEEVSDANLERFYRYYIATKPSILVCHEGPGEALNAMWPNRRFVMSRTGYALDAMIAAHRPKLVVFGHHHRTMDITINGVRYVCLGICDYMDINI